MYFRVFYLFIKLLLLGTLVQGQTSSNGPESLAQAAFESGHYELALYHYNQLAYQQLPQFVPETQFNIGLTYLELSQFEIASAFFDRAYHTSDVKDFQFNCILFKARSLLAQGAHALALQELYQIDMLPPNDALKASMLLLSGVCEYEMGNFDAAKASFVQLVSDTISFTKVFGKPKDFHRPNSKLAMIMSTLLPGAGQFYAGEYQEGINSFLITAVFVYYSFRIAAIYSSLDAIITVLPWFQRYYIGGYNKASLLAYEKMLEKRKTRLNHILTEIERQNQ